MPVLNNGAVKMLCWKRQNSPFLLYYSQLIIKSKNICASDLQVRAFALTPYRKPRH